MTDIMTKLEQAQAIIEQLFEGRQRISIDSVIAAAEEAGISYRTMQRAKVQMGNVIEIRNGPYSGLWERQG